MNERASERETQVKATKASYHCESGRGGHCEWAKNESQRQHLGWESDSGRESGRESEREGAALVWMAQR